LKSLDSNTLSCQIPTQSPKLTTTMDFVNKFTSQATGNQKEGLQQGQEQSTQKTSSGGFMDKLHGMAGGGPQSEKKEDALDKGIDWVQENVLKQGSQTNENAVEQAKDKAIAQTIRSQYQNATGKEFFIKEKE
ncbi:hypothetical protein BT67DRAFT_353412, partial [Trichocladium antarcticum]